MKGGELAERIIDTQKITFVRGTPGVYLVAGFVI
jgi:hypothetical protein